ncbi:hypothetical protein V3C99_008410 [Haemonchus contortus]
MNTSIGSSLPSEEHSRIIAPEVNEKLLLAVLRTNAAQCAPPVHEKKHRKFTERQLLGSVSKLTENTPYVRKNAYRLSEQQRTAASEYHNRILQSTGIHTVQSIIKIHGRHWPP